MGKPVRACRKACRDDWEPFDYRLPPFSNPLECMKFEYPEDRKFFADLLAGGDEEKLEKEFSEHFDFRHPAIKRWEFNKIKNKLLKKLIVKHVGKCQLRIHVDCSKDGKYEPDHIIPLSTNELNKKLRRMVRNSSEKIPAQSFGSNKPENLTLSCKRCNAFKKHRIVLPAGFSGRNNLNFLQPHKAGSEIFQLPSGKKVKIKKYFLQFKLWKGKPIPNTYGNKAVIDFNGEPVFAELAVLRLFQSQGWDGVWVDSYYRKYRVGLPDVATPVELPEKQQKIIDSIRAKTGKSGGCWDVFVWKKDQILFIELKRNKKDHIQESQKMWMEKSLNYGLSGHTFLLLEWILN